MDFLHEKHLLYFFFQLSKPQSPEGNRFLKESSSKQERDLHFSSFFGCIKGRLGGLLHEVVHDKKRLLIFLHLFSSMQNGLLFCCGMIIVAPFAILLEHPVPPAWQSSFDFDASTISPF
jgi:hypothetical protein